MEETLEKKLIIIKTTLQRGAISVISIIIINLISALLWSLISAPR